MNLNDLGYHSNLDKYIEGNNIGSLIIGRVVSEHKERYMVKTPNADYEAEILGNLRFTAQSRTDFPAVGDWVAMAEYDKNKALIHHVLPRKTIIERQAVGKKGEKQIIATNIDCAFIVQAVDRDFNINRIERYLAICNAAGVEPIIILNKIDLLDKESINTIVQSIKSRIKNIALFAISNQSQQGIEQLKANIEKGKTYCLLGSSGVGKSSLLNTLLGREFMQTDTISTSTNKGRHVTTHRELQVLDNGGIIIDNPGMREVGIADAANGLETTFDQLLELAEECRFANCTHTTEKGCAVIEAVKNGSIDQMMYDNYLKLQREQQHYESTIAERRQKKKELGKLIKHYKKIKGNN
ncbi:MAG: ribosome small subunit-dependent GTPase A [Prolixibacteraceae bacterium]|nr:ribosome small subunit-dependent GTPase A [Prolixibacteraceae bacterium]